MPRNGSGTYSLPQPAFVSGAVIASAAMNSDLSDIAAALTQSVSKDGQTAMTGPLNMGGQAITNASTGTFSGAMTLNGATTINNTVVANGAVTVNNTATLNGATTINNTLAVSGATTLTNTLSITHAATGLTIKQSGVGAVTGMDVSTANVAGPLAAFRFGTTLVGSITTDGVNCAYNNLSDERLKIDDGELAGIGSLIDAISPRWFRWKSEPERQPQPGFMAQQVYECYPWAVTAGADDVPWQMDAAKLMPLVIAELKDLRRRVKELGG